MVWIVIQCVCFPPEVDESTHEEQNTYILPHTRNRELYGINVRDVVSFNSNYCISVSMVSPICPCYEEFAKKVDWFKCIIQEISCIYFHPIWGNIPDIFTVCSCLFSSQKILKPNGSWRMSCSRNDRLKILSSFPCLLTGERKYNESKHRSLSWYLDTFPKIAGAILK